MHEQPIPASSRTDALQHPATIEVDLRAIRDNAAALKALALRNGAKQLMGVIKANAYGHGLIPAAKAALAGGADYLGVAQASEALTLRQAGVDARLVTWLYAPTTTLAPLLAADVEVGVSSLHGLQQIQQAADDTGRRAIVHVKVDTGLGRGGSPRPWWTELFAALSAAESTGTVEVRGIWSHFASADEPGDPSIQEQLEVFERGIEAAHRAGLRPSLRHIANSAATLTLPEAAYDMVRPGLAMYGLSPVPQIGSPADFGLRPAMSVSTQLALVKPTAAGQGVSYGLTYRTKRDTVLGLVPLGYADGVPRAASSVAPVQVGGARHRIAGRVCMDQFVVDLGPDPDGEWVDGSTRAVLFGSGEHGEPTAQDWADATGTISYEIVTRFAPRLPRSYLGAEVIGGLEPGGLGG